MTDLEKIKGKRILIVDDEPDILETLEELLEGCIIDAAGRFEGAKTFLEKNDYDAAVLDIMGVQGYELLKLATEKEIPALMLTAHALSPDNLVKSIKTGANAYIPKDKIADIAAFIADIIEAHESGQKGRGKWYSRLKPFFDKKFKAGWRKKDEAFWREFDSRNIVSKTDVDKML